MPARRCRIPPHPGNRFLAVLRIRIETIWIRNQNFANSDPNLDLDPDLMWTQKLANKKKIRFFLIFKNLNVNLKWNFYKLKKNFKQKKECYTIFFLSLTNGNFFVKTMVRFELLFWIESRLINSDWHTNSDPDTGDTGLLTWYSTVINVHSHVLSVFPVWPRGQL